MDRIRRAPRWVVATVGLVVVSLVVGGTVAIASFAFPSTADRGRDCPAPADHPDWSVARRWDEAVLDAIRRALPAPTVHARNLYHVSAAMWDAWAAWDPAASGVFVREKREDADVRAARETAMSYAAYGILSARYENAVGAHDSLAEFDAVMDALCLPLDADPAAGDTPAAFGERIAATILAAARDDGSNEADQYAPLDYRPVNPPLTVAASGTTMTDPNRWQPLQIEHMISQNGIPVTNGVQQAVGPHWGHVTGFALPPAGEAGTPLDPGPPPQLGDPDGDAQFKAEAIEVIRDSASLDPAGPTTIDISPGARGGNILGTNDGHGHPVNPATGRPYEPDVVLAGDFGRVMAEFWADGPKSETPPGHWNVLANFVSDELPADGLRVGGSGEPVDRLEWDTKLYLAVNGAVHDAAIAAWGLKGHYDSARPISMIRYMGGLGQSSDAAGPSFDPEGLPLVPDLVEVITPETTAPGGRHAELAGHEGEIAVRSWTGTPADPATEVGGVRWILAVDWIPYQLPTFVTPAFPGYVSGHSTFSRAAAEVMAGFTGSEYFPGGISGYTIPAGSLKFELGPSRDIRLEWATYYDAADQAGQSRLYGGIHIPADDLTGRRIGSECGIAAWIRAQQYYTGQGAP